MAILPTEPARAHLDVRPGLVEAGTPVDLLVELPGLRPGERPTALELEGDGLEVLSTRLVDAVAGDTVWRVRIRVDTDPGTLRVVFRAVYADGRSAEASTSLVVLDDVEESELAWGTIALAVVAAACLGAAVLLLIRRRA